jgi:hypothetical protein
MTKTVKVKGIELDVNQRETPYIPTMSTSLYKETSDLYPLATAIKTNLNVLIYGPAGIGKTSAIEYLAKKTNNSLRRINLSQGITEDQFLGYKTRVGDTVTFIDGVVTDCMRNNYWLLLDELNAATGGILYKLHSILDYSRSVLLEENGGEVIKAGQDFKVFACMNDNSSGKYYGTNPLNEALKNRFGVTFRFVGLDSSQMTHILVKKGIPEQYASDIMVVFNNYMQCYNKGEFFNAISFRNLEYWAELCMHISMDDAFLYGVLGNLDPDESTALREVFKARFGSSGKLVVGKLKTEEKITPAIADENVVVDRSESARKGWENRRSKYPQTNGRRYLASGTGVTSF